jgi:hypothetical protein
MESRTVFSASAISRSIVAVVAAVLAAFILGATGGYLAKSLSLPVAPPTAHVAAGQTTATGFDSAWQRSNLPRGPVTVDGPASTGSSSSGNDSACEFINHHKGC